MATADPPEPELLSAAQVAALLGVSRCAIWRWHSSGRLPLPVRLGRGKWRRRELIDWINRGAPPRSRWSWPPDGREAER